MGGFMEIQSGQGPEDELPKGFDVMLPITPNCFVPASQLCDSGTGARFRAARLLQGLSHSEVAERGNQSAVVQANIELQSGRMMLTAELVKSLEENPGGTPLWMFEAVAHGIGRDATEIMELEMRDIRPFDSEA